MGLNFKKIAEDKGIIQGGLLANRTRARLQSIVGEPVTIVGVQVAVGKLEGQVSRYPAIVLNEYPNSYFSAGAQRIAQLISGWADEADCPVDDDAMDAGYSCVHKNYDALTEAMVNQGGVPIVFKLTRNPATGHDYLDFDLI